MTLWVIIINCIHIYTVILLFSTFWKFSQRQTYLNRTIIFLIKKNSFFTEPTLITMLSGKQYYLYQGYTYCLGSKASNSRNGKRCRCTNTSECFAYIRITNEGELIRVGNTHSHPPNMYHIMRDGRYLKVKIWAVYTLKQYLCNENYKMCICHVKVKFYEHQREYFQ